MVTRGPEWGRPWSGAQGAGGNVVAAVPAVTLVQGVRVPRELVTIYAAGTTPQGFRLTAYSQGMPKPPCRAPHSEHRGPRRGGPWCGGRSSICPHWGGVGIYQRLRPSSLHHFHPLQKYLKILHQKIYLSQWKDTFSFYKHVKIKVFPANSGQNVFNQSKLWWNGRGSFLNELGNNFL